MTETTAYLLLRLQSWNDFEPAPGSWAPFPVSVKGEGMGFFILYATREEAEAAGGTSKEIWPIVIRKKDTP